MQTGKLSKQEILVRLRQLNKLGDRLRLKLGAIDSEAKELRKQYKELDKQDARIIKLKSKEEIRRRKKEKEQTTLEKLSQLTTEEINGLIGELSALRGEG
jgi:acetyl-CoA carboxylase carboxyltransferase component